MSSLRSLNLHGDDTSILDGCTLRLDLFTCHLPYDEALLEFLNSQPTLTQVTFTSKCACPFPLEKTSLPNLTDTGTFPFINLPLTHAFDNI